MKLVGANGSSAIALVSKFHIDPVRYRDNDLSINYMFPQVYEIYEATL